MANSGPFYEEGRYRCEVTDQGLSTASTGTVQIVLKVRVLEGTQPERDLSQQYERTVYLSVTEKTMQYLVPKLQALGYDRDSMRYINLNEPQHHDLRGTIGEFFCKHQDNKEKWDVAARSSNEPLELKPVDAKILRQLDTLFGKERKASGVVSRPKPVAVAVGPRDEQAPPETDWGISDDDVPF